MYKKRNLMTAITRLRETAIGLTPPELARQSYHGLSAAATIFFAKSDTKATHRGNPDLRQRGKESREAKNKRLSRGSFFMPPKGRKEHNERKLSSVCGDPAGAGPDFLPRGPGIQSAGIRVIQVEARPQRSEVGKYASHSVLPVNAGTAGHGTRLLQS